MQFIEEVRKRKKPKKELEQDKDKEKEKEKEKEEEQDLRSSHLLKVCISCDFSVADLSHP